MATIEDLQDVLTSVDASTKEQTTILRNILGIQESIFESQKRTEEMNKVSRTQSDPGTSGGSPSPGASGDTNNGFDFDKLGMLGTAFSLAIGTTIGLVTGQLTAIRTFFTAFVPNLVKTFDDFKNGVATKFLDLVTDLKIRFAFISVAIEEAVTNSLQSIKSLFNISEQSNIGKIINAVKNSINTLITPFSIMIDTIKGLVTAGTGPVSILQDLFSGIKALLSSLGRSISAVAGVVGKIFAPIAIIMTAFDTIKGALDGYAEGGLLGGFKGAIDGFFTSLVTIPLDLIKDMVGWIVGKLGFDETSTAISSFSFTELWTDMTEVIFNGLQSAFEWIGTLFTDPTAALASLWKGLVGEGGIVDMIWYPYNLAIDWISKKLGWREEDAPTFSLMGFFGDVFNTLKEKFISFGEYVSGIPDQISFVAQEMWIDLKEKLKLGFFDLADWISRIPAKLKAMIYNIIGSATIENPFTGTKYSLISQEDINTANTEANKENPAFAKRKAEIIAQAKEERQQLSAAQLEKMQSNALSKNNVTVVYNSPNNSQTNVTTNGGVTTSSNFISGGSSSELRYLSHSGAQ